MRDAKEIASELETLLVRLAELDTQIEESSAEALAAQEPDSRIKLHQGMQAALDGQKALLQRVKTVSKEYIRNISRTFWNRGGEYFGVERSVDGHIIKKRPGRLEP